MGSLSNRLLGALQRLATGSYTVTRLAAGTYSSAGIYTPGGSSQITIAASIQPVSGRDLQRLPEALRTTQLICIWTSTPLQTALAPAGNPPDVVSYKGLSFECQTVLDWSDSGDFFKVIAQKVGQ